MGLRSALARITGRTDALAAAAYYDIGGAETVTTTTLPAEVAAAFGLAIDLDTVTRKEAMTIPAMRRARQVICGTIGVLPLTAVRLGVDGSEVAVPCPLLDQPDRNTTRQHVLTWTADDLLFVGYSWWRVTEYSGTFPNHAERLAPHRVFVDRIAGKVFVDGTEQDPHDLIRFDGADEGILATSATTLRTCVILEQAVRRHSDGLPPLDFLRLAENASALSSAPGSCGIPGDPRSEVDLLLDSWKDARRKRSTAYLNRAIEHGIVGFDAQKSQLAEAREYQAAEVARLTNLPPRYVNAPSATSMTYSNVESERRDLVDLALAPYLAPFDQRLSMPDVTPRGQVVRWDLTRLLRGDAAAASAAAKTGAELGVLGATEIRRDYFGRPGAVPADVPVLAPSPAPGGNA